MNYSYNIKAKSRRMQDVEAAVPAPAGNAPPVENGKHTPSARTPDDLPEGVPPKPTGVWRGIECLGSINITGLQHPAFHVPKISQYEELGDLTTELGSLEARHTQLLLKLKNLLNSPHPTPFAQFKTWLMQMETRLADRDREARAFCVACDSGRHETTPSFIQVRSRQLRPTKYDPLSGALLSGAEKSLFMNEDLENQNQELRELVLRYQQTLALLQQRLSLFEEYQKRAMATAAREALAKGKLPTKLAMAAPTKANELRGRLKLLRGELMDLLSQRRAILDSHNQGKMRKRGEFLLVQKTIRIQSAARGFLGRRRIALMKRSAIVIQRIWRGFSVRSSRRRDRDRSIAERPPVSPRSKKQFDEESAGSDPVLPGSVDDSIIRVVRPELEEHH